MPHGSQAEQHPEDRRLLAALDQAPVGAVIAIVQQPPTAAAAAAAVMEPPNQPPAAANDDQGVRAGGQDATAAGADSQQETAGQGDAVVQDAGGREGQQPGVTASEQTLMPVVALPAAAGHAHQASPTVDGAAAGGKRSRRACSTKAKQVCVCIGGGSACAHGMPAC